MKYFYTLLLITAISFQSQAQRNFKSGYIVTLSGDTTKGFVDYKEWNQNPREISFKTTEQAASQQYSPTNIKAFGINQVDHYQKYVGPITKGAVDLADLSSGIDSSFVTDTIFLRIITGGKNVTLYNYTDKVKTRYFIADKNAVPVELKRYVYLDNKQSDRIREFNFHIQQLLALAIKYSPDDAELTERINKVQYKAPALEDIVLKINGKTNNYSFNSAKRGSVGFFIGAGANLVKASFFGKDYSGANANVFNANTSVTSVTPVISGGVDFYFNKNVKKLLFRAEGYVTTNKIKATHSGSFKDYINEVGREEEVTFNQVSFSINPQFIYNIYNTSSFKFFMGGGFQTTLSSFGNKHDIVKNSLNGKLENTKDLAISYRSITTNLTAKAGVTVASKFEVYLGYYAPVAVTNYPTYGINLASYRVGVNYLFGEK